MNEDWELLNQQLLNVIPKKIEYRLYYNKDTGAPLFFSGGDFPESGNFVIVSKDIYDKCRTNNIKVVNNEITYIDLTPHFKLQLKRSNVGWRTAKNHAGVLDLNSELDDIQYFDRLKND